MLIRTPVLQRAQCYFGGVGLGKSIVRSLGGVAMRRQLPLLSSEIPSGIQTLADRALFGIIDFEMLKHIGVQAVQTLITQVPPAAHKARRRQ